MEEQRQRYGPFLYILTNLVLSIRLFVLLSWGHFEAKQPQKDKLAVLEQAVDVYTSELELFLKFIGNSDSYKEITIPAGKSHEDIGFSMEYISPSGEFTLILPHRRFEADQGNFSALKAGKFELIWDNLYSTFFKMCLRYKLDAAPVVETPESVAEMEGNLC